MVVCFKEVVCVYMKHIIKLLLGENTGLVKIMLTLMDCGIIYSPRNVCPGF